MTDFTQTDWMSVGSVDQFQSSNRFVTKVDGKQIAVFKTDSGIFAINNRCPHEGYPLSEGTVQDTCIIACNWHGWTFNLESGEAIHGRDPVKTYPVKVADEQVWIDLSPPSVEERRNLALSEYNEASEEHDYERIARSLCRYEKAGGRYEDLAALTVGDSLDKLERGFGHAHAGLADWMALAGTDNDLRLVGFLEALGHFSWDMLFGQSAPFAKATLEWDGGTFLQAIEAMDQDRAVSLCRGAFDAGLGFTELKPIFLDQIFRHYAGFGHPAIYVMKAEELINTLGRDVEQALTLQLTRYLCLAAREDLIPEFRQFGVLLAQKQVAAAHSLPTAIDLSGMSLKKLLPLIDSADNTDEETWERLLGACAWDMLSFNEQLQHIVAQPIAQNVGWLAFTHAITFAEALHFHAQKNSALWRSGHLQQACFIGRNARYLNKKTAHAMLDRYCVEDIPSFFAKQKAALFDMDAGEYIYSVHRLKLVRAIEKLLGHVQDDTAKLLVAALNRFLSTAMRHKHPARTAYQARTTIQNE